MNRFLTAILLTACGALSAGELSLDDVFPTDRVLDVQIEVDDKDWDTIRRQSRDLLSALPGSRKTAPTKSPYTYVEANVTIDGVNFPRVGIRKKGFIGSQSLTRPSLKIKLNYIDPEGAIDGLKNLTLNNNKQDASMVCQFMGYALFNAVGSPAPRAAYANVTVNGKNLGIYTHVESARKPLLERGFGDPGGTLFEGTVIDFCDGWEGAFEWKRGDDASGREKIKELISTLNRDSGRVIVGAESEKRAWVPTSGQLDSTWTAIDFDDSAWVTGRDGAGFETGKGYETHLDPDFDFKQDLYGRGTSIYMRVPFEIDDPAKIGDLTLRMKFDDGFVAFINGQHVLAVNAPQNASWESEATGSNSDRAAVKFQPFPLSELGGVLRKGTNVLAIHGLNHKASSSDMLIVPELRSSETSLLEAIGKLVDLDAFYKFWAMEGLLGFWDGYAANRNNFFVYVHPHSGRIHFLPWGADSLFEKYSKINPDRRAPLSVKTVGLVAHKLYQFPSGRRRYRETMEGFLDTIWNEEKLLAETERIETLLEPFMRGAREKRRFSLGLNKIRDFIRTRRDDITEEIADGMPIWTKTPNDLPVIPLAIGIIDRVVRILGGARIGPGNETKGKEYTLWSAAREGDLEALKEHLESVDVNERDKLGVTALSWAARLGRLKAVEFLIEKGADINARNRDGSTPLDSAEGELDEEAVALIRTLVANEIDLEKVNDTRPKAAALLRKHDAKRGADLRE